MTEQELREGPHLKLVDDFLQVTVLRFIPYSVTPNSLTVIRFISIPMVAALLFTGEYEWGAGVFAFGALTDALDGAMARTRNQITPWGKIADPLADKLLIGTTALILVTRYVNVWLAILIVGLELALIIRAVYRYAEGKTAGANAMGKVKMVMQSIALLTLFVYVLSGAVFFLSLAIWGLYAAILFAFLSLTFAPSA